MSVDFDFWVDTKADGITITIDSDEIDSCEEDDDPEEPEPMRYTITGHKKVQEGDAISFWPEWTIYLKDGEGNVASTTTTDENGQFWFTDLEPGVWEVEEELPEGWSQVGVYQNGYPTEGDTCIFKFPKLVPIFDSYQIARVSEALIYDQDAYTCEFYNERTGEGSDDDQDDDDEQQGTLVGGQGGGVQQVLGAATSQCPFLIDYMQIGWENDPIEVAKLQLFLNIFKDTFGGTDNPITREFDATTDRNVKAFQSHYRSEILDPWYLRGIVPHYEPTGFVYKTTLWKINSIICPDYAILPDYEGEDLTENVDID